MSTTLTHQWKSMSENESKPAECHLRLRMCIPSSRGLEWKTGKEFLIFLYSYFPVPNRIVRNLEFQITVKFAVLLSMPLIEGVLSSWTLETPESFNSLTNGKELLDSPVRLSPRVAALRKLNYT